MIPLSNVVHTEWTMGSPNLVRYNGYSAIEIVGSQAPGKSSGEAMQTMQDIITKDLPQGFGYDWTGQSLQEIISGNQAPMLFALSILVVFLCLAALYESWSIPVAVLLVVPLGVLGAVLATWAPRLDQRRVLQDRTDNDHRPGRKERDPDRRVRGRRTTRRAQSRHRGRRRGTPAPAPDPDDLVRVHPRRACRWRSRPAPAPTRVTRSAPA